MERNHLAQIFGMGAMLALFLVYQQSSRRRLLAAKLSADVCWAAHYACLGGTAGMIPNLLGIGRELIFLQRNGKRWANHVLWPIGFILLNWGLGLRTFHSAWNLLPIAASTVVTVALWLNDPRLTKLLSIPVSLAFLVYDLTVGSYIGVVNEAISMGSILLYVTNGRIKTKKEKTIMRRELFSKDHESDRELTVTEGAPIAKEAGKLRAEVSRECIRRGDEFAREIEERFVSDFERADDKMAHVSTFLVVDGVVYMTYYANTKEPSEDPKNQTARLVWAPMDDWEHKVFLDIQSAGDRIGGKTVEMVYDTILMQKDADTLYVMWTARVEDNYYRFYRPFDLSSKALGEIGVNRFRAGNVVNDFSVSGIQSALRANGLPCKRMYSDIGVMQKQSSRIEDGVAYTYTGAYCGDFTCIVKSRDLITWEYVSQPDFINNSQWENATYVKGDKCYYFVRQQGYDRYGFLTAYDLNGGTWETPVLVEDCQSRGDFIEYQNELYLFCAPIGREHIGVIRIDPVSLPNSRVILQAKMYGSCFYPFVQYFRDNELAMSYTVDRKHIRLAEFTLSRYLAEQMPEKTR